MSLKNLPNRPNVVLIISDQQTWLQNWNEEWAKQELPAMQKLMKNGLTFNKAHCNSCTCSPSRTTLFTGTYPAHHKVYEVLGFDQPTSMKQTMQNTLSSNYQNMAKMMEESGYHVAYKGKWHMTKPAVYLNNEDSKKVNSESIDQLYWTPFDVDHIADNWRFKEWNYPDAGDDLALFNFGGGDINNDGRFVDGHGDSAWYGDAIPLEDRIEASTVEFINTYKDKNGEKPFFLVVSLVNPHDVLSYPGLTTGEEGRDNLYIQAGYKEEDFTHIQVTLPETVNENLDTKPTVQSTWKALCQANGPIQTEAKAEKYVQFYAYLTSLVDKEIDKVLQALEKNNFIDNTLIIRTSDHGDMSMAHGMQRQKMYNVYRESLNVPMIFSNPLLFPNPIESNSLSSLVDLMPTLASIIQADKTDLTFQGKDLTPIIEDPNSEVQDYLHFTYDDTYLETNDPSKMGPAYIRCIHNKEWKYAVYFDPHYGHKMEYEMYDLSIDPIEANNLAHEFPSIGYEDQRQFLHDKLTEIMQELGTMPDAVIWPEISGVDPTATQINKAELIQE